MKIGDLAEWAKCPAVTIRYYEKIGLLSGDKRDRLNHRLYDHDDMERLRFIMHCRHHGIPMRDIRSLLAMGNNSGETGADGVAIIRKQIENLKKQRQSLDRLIESLSRVLDAAEPGDSNCRDVIEVLGSPCPDCADYMAGENEGIRKGKKAGELANPESRSCHNAFRNLNAPPGAGARD